MQLRFRTANARGRSVGACHWAAKHTDAVVAQARALHAAGWSHKAVAEAVGAPRPTVTAWLIGTRRRPHARIVVQCVDSDATDSQSSEK